MFIYELWLTDDAGKRIALTSDVGGFEYIRRVNGVGGFSVNLRPDFDLSLLGLTTGFPDRRVEIWRGAPNVRKSLETVGLIRKLNQRLTASGDEFLTVSGPDQNDLVGRRIIGYFSGTLQVNKSAEADDVIKAYCDENFGASVGGAGSGLTLRRDWSGDGVSIQADLTLGPTIDKEAAWRNLSNAVDEIAENAQGDGTRVYWAMVPLDPTSFQLRTWIDQPGRDLTDDVIFDAARGNLDDPELIYDYTEEATVVYCGGQGQGTGRMLAVIVDTDRLYTSIYNRREVFQDARNATSLDAVIDEGKARMSRSTPVLRFTGTVKDTPQSRYGVEWDLGDRVTVNYQSQQFDAIINAVAVAVDGTGKETITARVENVTYGQVGTLLVDTIQTPVAVSKSASTSGPTVTIA